MSMSTTDYRMNEELSLNTISKDLISVISVKTTTRHGTSQFGATSSTSSIRKIQIQTFLDQNIMVIATMASVVLAFVFGITLRLTIENWSPRSLMYLELPGQLFLQMLKCLILPLVVSSLISALGNLDVKLSGNIGKRAVIYYMATTVLAIVLGIVLVSIISPGTNNKVQGSSNDLRKRIVTIEDSLLDLIRNIFPPNLVQACFEQYLTSLEAPKNMLNETDIYKWKMKGSFGNGTNFMGLIFFSVVFGVIIGRMQAAGKPLLDFFVALNEVTMKLTGLIIWLTPIGVFFLIMSKIISVEDVSKLFGGVSLYATTVLLGLFIHTMITLPTIYFVVVRKNPFRFMIQFIEVMMTAFGTSSSLATLPVTINCLEKTRLDKRVVRFVAPIGATINMDGTALYEAVATIFIAQSRGVEMDLAKLVIISVMATAGSVGTAGVPHGSLATLFMVLNSVGLPAEDISLVFVVDWLLARFRTGVNVLGDCFGAAVVAHLSREDLEMFESET